MCPSLSDGKSGSGANPTKICHVLPHVVHHSAVAIRVTAINTRIRPSALHESLQQPTMSFRTAHEQKRASITSIDTARKGKPVYMCRNSSVRAGLLCRCNDAPHRSCSAVQTFARNMQGSACFPIFHAVSVTFICFSRAACACIYGPVVSHPSRLPLYRHRHPVDNTQNHFHDV